MKILLKFLKITISIVFILVIGLVSFLYYQGQTLDHTALDCKTKNKTKSLLLMLRKKPFADNYRGLYVSPINSKYFNKNTELEDLYMLGSYKESSKNSIAFQHRNDELVIIYLDRVTLNLKFSHAFKGTLFHYECEIIDHKNFYNSIRGEYNKEKNKLKL